MILFHNQPCQMYCSKQYMPANALIYNCSIHEIMEVSPQHTQKQKVGGRADFTGSYLLLCFLLLPIILPYSHIPNLILSSLLQLGQFRHQDPKIKSKMISGNDKCEPPDSIKSLANSDQHPRFNRNIRN